MPDRRTHQTIAERYDLNASQQPNRFHKAKLIAFALGLAITAVIVFPTVFTGSPKDSKTDKPKNAFRQMIKNLQGKN